MQGILLIFYMLQLVTVLCHSLDDASYTHLKTCRNRTTDNENCSGNYIAFDRDSAQTNITLHLKLNSEVHRIPLAEFDPSIFVLGSRVTVEQNGTSFVTPIASFLDLPIYEGTNENDTYASGYFANGTFRGFLMLKNGSSIFLESLEFENQTETSNGTVRQIAYEATDVKFADCSSSNGSSNCRENGFSESLSCKRESKRRISCFMNSNESDGALWPRSANDYNFIKEKPLLYPTRNASCTISLSTDPNYYALHNHNLQSALSDLVIVLKLVGTILVAADFDGDGLQDGFSLRVSGVTLNLGENHLGGSADEDALLNTMEEFRRIPQDECLALMFVGAAMESNWISTTFGGGVCKNNDKEPDPARNTAIINTVDSMGIQRPLFSTAWTVAMVIGQLMGSVEKTCKTSSPYPLAGDWTSFFSVCGRENIAAFLQRQGSCLKFPDDKKRALPKLEAEIEVVNTSCGNKDIDPGEECDCGTTEECKKMQSCCVPPGNLDECRYNRAKGFECDWTEDCCSRNCKIVPKSWNTFCGRGEASCAMAGAYCDGKNPHCPVHRSASGLKDGEPCGPATLRQAGAATCKGGFCNSTVCRDAGLDDCMCDIGTGHQCRVCCKKNGTLSDNLAMCVPAEYFGLKLKSGRFYFRYPGTPCSEVRFGHCDKYGACIRFQTVGFSSATIIRECHYYVVLILLFLYF